jgi:hypothetical protein
MKTADQILDFSILIFRGYWAKKQSRHEWREYVRVYRLASVEP